ncbi:MAG: GNAT family N-acetyltransferase [Candidatus Zixiibacteriota bacterium]|nr:MAG: GNAT family N-acetyltransferase [candidate division Zixibacteria bacterium]
MTEVNTTLIADATVLLKPEVNLPEGFRIAASSPTYESQLAVLWFEAYPPEIATDIDCAKQEIRDMFAGEYGGFWPEASPIILFNKELVAGICTVVKAPWEKTPTCPFIIDLMVHPDYRRKGLAAFLIQQTAKTVLRDGKTHVALRVQVDNRAAITLYRKLGFVDWDGRLFAPIGRC